MLLPDAGALAQTSLPVPQSTPVVPRLLPMTPLERVTGDPPHQGPHPEIPCFCLFQGRQFSLGDVVCMQTHIGTVLTRCELVLNNTSWTPSRQPCEISSLPSRPMTRAPATAPLL